MASECGSQSKVLVVEGQDDKHVVRHICARNGLPGSLFCIENKEGAGNVLKSIRLEVMGPNRTAVGFVLDADDSVDNVWRSISKRLAREGIPLPKNPEPGGTIVEGNARRIGIWLMPDNQSPGELEDFVGHMIPDCDPVWPLARGYIGKIPQEHRKFAQKKTIRAEVLAWLATREDPGLMGAAIGRHDLSTRGPLCSQFSRWLEKLFN